MIPHRPITTPARVIYLISCSGPKLPTRAEASRLYTSALFRYSLEYSRQHHPTAIYILSGLHGLVGLDAVIDPYDFNLTTQTPEYRQDWSNKVIKDLATVSNLNRDNYIILAGTKYYEFLLPVLPHHELPLHGLGLGLRIQLMKRFVDSSRSLAI